jgi:hypothetical protein
VQKDAVMMKLLLVFGFLAGASVFGQSGNVEPTAFETEMLELINRLRAEPQKESEMMATSGIIPGHVDIGMFKKEMATEKAVQPLVFNVKLLQAARNHTQYQLSHGQGHTEEAGKKGFTGKGIMDRYRHVGYSGGGGENVFIYCKNPWHGQVAFVVDWKLEGSDGGMQAGRGHRKNMMRAGYTQVGVGMASETNCAVTQNFGSGGRFIGGVAYKDKNKNGRYDAGEGIDDVEISFGGKTIKTWKSGAYVLPAGSKGGKVSAKWGSKHLSGLVPSGGGNFKFDFIEDKAQGSKMTFVSIFEIDNAAQKEGFKKFFSSRMNEIMKDGDEMDDAVSYFKKTALRSGENQASAKELYRKILVGVTEEIDYLAKLIVVKPSLAYTRVKSIYKMMGSDPVLKQKVAEIIKSNISKDLQLLVKLDQEATKVLNDSSMKDFVRKSQLRRVIKGYTNYLNKSIPAELRNEARLSLDGVLAKANLK